MNDYELELKKDNSEFGFTLQKYNLSLDASISFGGTGNAANPVEAVLASIGSCIAIHIIDIIKQKQLSVELETVKIITKNFSETTFFEKITTLFTFKKNEYNETELLNIIDEAKNTCPLKKIINQDIQLHTKLLIIE